jgi:GAF domain-containing protein
MPHLQAANVTFLELRNTVLCVQCELISYNNTSNCLACGSSALLTLNRVLGGSLRNQQSARLLEDELIDRVVEGILQRSAVGSLVPELWLGDSEAMVPHFSTGVCRTLPNALPQLQPAMRWIVDRALTTTRAAGAALALSRHGKLICHASAGSMAPDLGTEIDLHRGISGLCARSGMSWRCDSAESDPHVDRFRCHELGTESVVATPISHLNSVLGVLEVFSSQKSAFSDQDVATVQLLAGLLLVAISRGGRSHAIQTPQASAF